jgi:hypothetical protein
MALFSQAGAQMENLILQWLSSQRPMIRVIGPSDTCNPKM